MKLKSRELKAMARESLLGNYGTIIAAVLILVFITVGLEGISSSFSISGQSLTSMITGLIVTLIVGVLIYLVQTGLLAMILKMIRKEPLSIGDIFYVFSHHPDRFIIVGAIEIGISFIIEIPSYFLTPSSANISDGKLIIQAVISSSLYAVAASVIAIIILLGFSLSEYLLIDDDDLNAIDSIKESFRLMKGNKLRFFLLDLSFIGIGLLACLSFGIGMIWLIPYMMTAQTFFYLEAIGQLPTTTAGENGGAAWYSEEPQNESRDWYSGEPQNENRDWYSGEPQNENRNRYSDEPWNRPPQDAGNPWIADDTSATTDSSDHESE